MKKKAFLFATLILPLFSLSACGEATFGYRSDDIPTIDQNGDLLVYTSSANLKYKNVTVAGNIEAYRNDIASNQDFFLLFTRDTCSHCLDLEPSFVDFALKSRLKIYRDPITDQEAMKSWASSYGEGSDMSSISENLATPVIHLVKANNGKPEAIYKNFYASTSSGKMLSEFFIKQLNRTNIYHFETLEGIVAFRKDNKQALYYFTSGTDDTFYRENIYELAKKSRKALAYINVNKLSDMDKEKLASMFPTSYSEDFLYQDGGDATASSFRSEDIGAKKMVDAYFKG